MLASQTSLMAHFDSLRVEKGYPKGNKV